MNQPTFADLDYESKKRKIRREKFLERMDGLIPWAELEERIRPFYPNAGRGRRPYELSAMLRIHSLPTSVTTAPSRIPETGPPHNCIASHRPVSRRAIVLVQLCVTSAGLACPVLRTFRWEVSM